MCIQKEERIQLWTIQRQQHDTVQPYWVTWCWSDNTGLHDVVKQYKSMHWFPVATVTIYDKVSDFKQHKFINLITMKVRSLKRGSWRVSVSLLFPASRGHAFLGSWSPSIFSASNGCQVFLTPHHSHIDSPASLFCSEEYLWLYCPIQITKDNLHFKILNLMIPVNVM